MAPQFLTFALDGGEYSASRPCPLTPVERVNTGKEAGCAPESVWTLRRREKSCRSSNFIS
jgi:hypothetical protein